MTQPPPSPREPNPWAPPREGAGAPPAPEAPASADGPPSAPYAPGGQSSGYGPTPPYGHPSAVPAPYGPPRNGMGVAALVLGLVGVFLGMAVFLFWASWLPALLAVIFGFVGLGHVKQGRANNRGLAMAGLILGNVGLLMALGGGAFTIVSVKAIVEHADESILEIEASESAEAAEEAKAEEAERAKEAAKHLALGETYTYENGLKVTVAAPRPYTPGEIAFGHEKGDKAIQLVVTVENPTSGTVTMDTHLPYVKDAKGVDTELLIDSSNQQRVLKTTFPPGKKAVGKYAYSLPGDAAAKIEVSLITDYGFVYWTGPTTTG
ncbi:DUF4190 domain-containing protein [Streptomyces sp. CA-294286]|uniref:DUF4190 domain-containing protein n=1 Tax=Streptomyces sp. CA-294286 TaxID=3240070 RepID=UPI003D9196AE